MIKTKSGVMIIGILFGILLVSAVNLTISNPSTGSIFATKSINYTLSSDEISDFYIIKTRLRSNSAKKLCDDVTSCNVTVSAREGNNNITIKIINANGDLDSENLDFLVDTRAPRKLIARPRDGNTISNTDLFTLRYTETNLNIITLNYGNTSLVNNATNITCPSGRKQTCEFDVNLSDFNGQEIRYWFDITDIAGNTQNTSVRLINVDTDAPNVVSQNYTINKRRVKFSFEIEEEDFRKIVFRDNSARRPKWIRLCSRLSVGSCIKTKTLRSGVHDIDIRAYDRAGNFADVYTNEIINII